MTKQKGSPLDAREKSHIIAITSIGASRQLAAQFVGCTPQVILAATRYDPEFAKTLRQTEIQAVLSHLKNVHDAGKQDRYWPASTWFLARRLPQNFASRGPDTITAEQLHELLTHIVRILVEAIPVPSIRKEVIKRLALLLRSLGRPVQRKPRTGTG